MPGGTRSGRYARTREALLHTPSPLSNTCVSTPCKCSQPLLRVHGRVLCADFIDLDEVKATSLLVENSEEVPPDAVVAALQVNARSMRLAVVLTAVQV